MPFGLESSAFRVRVSVEIDDLELVLESSTLGFELWLESSAFRVRIRVRVRVLFCLRVRIESIKDSARVRLRFRVSFRRIEG